MTKTTKGYVVIIETEKMTKEDKKDIAGGIHDGIQGFFSTAQEFPEVKVFDIDKDFKNGYEVQQVRNRIIKNRVEKKGGTV